MIRTLFAALFVALFAGQATASECRATVNGDEIFINAASFTTDKTGPTRRERLLAWPSKSLSKARGTLERCNSTVITAYLSETLEIASTEGYCLSRLQEGGYLLVPGERNFRGLCKTSVCEKVSATKEETIALSGAFASAAAGSATEGVTAITHGSGATILTGASSYFAGTLGTAGTTVMGFLTAPATLTVIGIGAVGLGGALYVCSG